MNETGEMRHDALRCPRCGYDQAGIAASWKDRCPLAGTCSECGLLFAWADVFVPPRCVGFVEHASAVKEFVDWGFRTFLGVWMPRRFWTRVKLEHPVRLRSAMVWFVCAAAIGYLVVPLAWRGVSICLNLVIGLPRLPPISKEIDWWTSLWWTKWSLRGHGVFRHSGYWNGLERVWNRFEYGEYPWWFLPLACMCSVSPAVFVLAPWTRARARIELRHVARWWIYGQGWVIALLLWLIGVAVCTAVQDANDFIPPMLGSGTLLVPSAPGWYEALNCGAFPSQSNVVMPLLWLGWLMWWNWNALARGMRLERPGRVWGVLMVPTVLVGALVATAGMAWLGIMVPGVR